MSYINALNLFELKDGYSIEELKQTYRALSKKYHPDYKQNASLEEQKESEELMKRINEAYDILKNNLGKEKTKFNIETYKKEKIDDLDKYYIDDDMIIAQAGCSIIALSYMAMNRSLSGLEWASGIPGTVGGACYMNAGAYLKSVSDVLISVTVLDEDYNVLEIPLKDLEFGYRKSNLMDKGYIILGAKFKLSKGNYDDILNLITERRERRYKNQPLNYPSAGSVFRNPDGDYAGRLIEECNLKGYIKGGAKISDMHANFIVNYNNATSSDVKDLIELAKLKVHEKFNIDLKCEQELFNWE